MINSNFGFTPLKEVWLGDCYPESFYDHLPNEIADPFRQITEWTKTDLTKLQKFLEGRGIVVRRPVFSNIENYLTQTEQLVKPPITPRDDYFVLNDTLYSLHNHCKIDPWIDCIELYRKQNYNVQTPVDQPINCMNPPAVVRMGKDIYIDTISHADNWGFVCEVIVELSKNYRINICQTNGHSDGVFCPLKPGVIVSTHYKTDYSQSFPGWDVISVPAHFQNFNNPKNWLLGDTTVDNNISFSNHIVNNAQNWVGNYKETVFEVNMLVLDQQNVICMKEHKSLFQKLEQYDITAHVFDFRCRSFWDGGWHCLTLDINRDDSKIDLFPDRGENGVYWRLK